MPSLKNLQIQNKNLKIVCLVLSIIVIFSIIAIITYIKIIEYGRKRDKTFGQMSNDMVNKKYASLFKVLGKATYIEVDENHKIRTATWMSPLDKFSDFGKYGGCDLIKIHNDVSRKYHPHPAKVFLIVGKYIKVPDNLLGPIKFASETINIEQLFVPKKYADKYYNTGQKEIALVTGSCASVTISAITVQFVIDMIEKYKDTEKNILKLYPIFRNEYDRRIDDYLCGKGITDSIPWYDNNFFEEPEIYNIGEEKCKKIENFTQCKFGDMKCMVKERYKHKEG
tara:strand:+ start:1016 stop:1861 length:846 start_codon:yes stop_codon:yes gene_type:complete